MTSGPGPIVGHEFSDMQQVAALLMVDYYLSKTSPTVRPCTLFARQEL